MYNTYKYIYYTLKKKKKDRTVHLYVYLWLRFGLVSPQDQPLDRHRQTPTLTNGDALPVLGRRAAVERRMQWMRCGQMGKKGDPRVDSIRMGTLRVNCTYHASSYVTKA